MIQKTDRGMDTGMLRRLTRHATPESGHLKKNSPAVVSAPDQADKNMAGRHSGMTIP
nr:hypothetical protein [Herbaspirillum sp. ASV7]